MNKLYLYIICLVKVISTSINLLKVLIKLIILDNHTVLTHYKCCNTGQLRVEVVFENKLKVAQTELVKNIYG